MRILFDILHPAHVHFFRNAIKLIIKDGHKVIVTARDKDLTLKLLDLYRIPYLCISKEAQSKVGLARELLSRNRRLLTLVKSEQPDVMTSIGGISTAQVGFITRTRNLIFYDTETATTQNLLSYPFAREVITPACYKKKVLGRHVTYPGYHELAYLHSDRFSPDHEVLSGNHINPYEVYTVVRFVSWNALHDVRARGFSSEQIRLLVKSLEKYGRVYISSESALPGEFERFRLPISPEKVHHLLAFARLFIGESATMASESVTLGTPAIYLDKVGRGYTDEQETRYGLCFNYRPWEGEKAIAKAEEILSADLKNDPDFRTRVEKMLSEKIDVTELIVSKLTGTMKSDT
jgi:predicted glycosyltransferase